MWCPILCSAFLLLGAFPSTARQPDTAAYSRRTLESAEDTALMREPSSLRRTAMAAIRVYQKMVSPLYGDVCNFYPSCSHYGFQAFQQHGFWQGLLLTSDRLQRCHFWAAGSGQYRVHAATGKLDDPVANHAWSATQPDNNGKGCEARAGNDRGNVSAEPEQ